MEPTLKEILDKAELMGFDRGVQTVFIQIFKAMEEEKMRIISYESLKSLYIAIMNTLK